MGSSCTKNGKVNPNTQEKRSKKDPKQDLVILVQEAKNENKAHHTNPSFIKNPEPIRMETRVTDSGIGNGFASCQNTTLSNFPDNPERNKTTNVMAEGNMSNCVLPSKWSLTITISGLMENKYPQANQVQVTQGCCSNEEHHTSGIHSLSNSLSHSAHQEHRRQGNKSPDKYSIDDRIPTRRGRLHERPKTDPNLKLRREKTVDWINVAHTEKAPKPFVPEQDMHSYNGSMSSLSSAIPFSTPELNSSDESWVNSFIREDCSGSSYSLHNIQPDSTDQSKLQRMQSHRPRAAVPGQRSRNANELL